MNKNLNQPVNTMQKDPKTPWWVYMALSSIQTRKGAMLLILSNVVFSAYCIPWASLYTEAAWVKTLFLIEDWEWFAWTAPMNIWYWFSVRWVDKNRGWETETASQQA